MNEDLRNRVALLPCPFCGGDAAFERLGSPRQSCIVSCDNCGCRLEANENWDFGTAWNTRADAALAEMGKPAPVSVREAALEKIEASHRHIESCLTFPVSTEINKRGYDTRSPTPETVEYMVDEVRAAQAALRATAEGKDDE